MPRLRRALTAASDGHTTAALAAAALVLVALASLWPSSSSGGDVEPLLVADLRGHALVVVDPTDPDAARHIALPGGPHELLRLPDGRVAVSLEQSGALALVDPGTGNVETLEVRGIPHGLALDGDTLLVTDRSADVIRRFAVDTWRELDPLPVEAWPHAVIVLPSGELAVAGAGAGTLVLGGRRFETGPVTETVALSPDGRRVATASAYDGALQVYSAGGDLIDTYEVGGRPVRVAFSPDGRTLAAALSASGAVAVISDGVETTVPVEGVPDGLAFSSDGRWLYVSDVAGGAVSAVDLETLVLAAVIPVGRSTGALLVLQR